MALASPSLVWGLLAGAVGCAWGLSEIIGAFKNETGRALHTSDAWLLVCLNFVAVAGIFVLVASVVPDANSWLAELLYLPTPFRIFVKRQLPDGVLAAQNTYGEAALRFDFPEESHRGWVNRLDDLLRGAGEAMGIIIARYAAELPSIEAWLDWAYEHERP